MRGRQVMLRPPEREDMAFLTALNSEPTVRDRVVGWDWPRSLSQQLSWFEKSASPSTQRFIVADSAGHPVGLTGLWDINWHDRNAIVGVKLGGPHGVLGRGLGSDALMALMTFAFEDVGLQRLHGSILAGNVASLRSFCDKCGWRKEGLSREHAWRNGALVDVVQIGVLKADFEEHPLYHEYKELALEP